MLSVQCVPESRRALQLSIWLPLPVFRFRSDLRARCNEMMSPGAWLLARMALGALVLVLLAAPAANGQLPKRGTSQSRRHRFNKKQNEKKTRLDELIKARTPCHLPLASCNTKRDLWREISFERASIRHVKRVQVRPDARKSPRGALPTAS